MSNIQLSIIVPVYNVEKYLRKCLDSLLDQGLTNYEVIVVNDGSTDNCESIIKEYVDKYPNLFSTYKKENGGLSSARNYGVPYAKGEYICFLDSDDYVEKQHYKKMYDLAKKDNADLVVSDFEYDWENNPNKILHKNGLEKVNADNKKCIFLSPLFSWNKLYRRELFSKLGCKYPEGLWYEDIPVTLGFTVNTNKISCLSEVGFHYLQRQTSIMGTRNSSKLGDIFKVFDIVYEYFVKNNLLKEYNDELEYLFVEHFLMYGAERFLKADNYKELMTKAFSYVKEHFPNYKKNKYLYTLGKKNNFFLKTNSLNTMGFWRKYLLWRSK